MEKLILQPGEWRRIYPAAGIQNKSNQSGIRLHISFAAQASQANTPAADTDVYFGIPEFDRKVIWLSSIIDNYASANYFVMPDEDMPVEIVVI